MCRVVGGGEGRRGSGAMCKKNIQGGVLYLY